MAENNLATVTPASISPLATTPTESPQPETASSAAALVELADINPLVPASLSASMHSEVSVVTVLQGSY